MASQLLHDRERALGLAGTLAVHALPAARVAQRRRREPGREPGIERPRAQRGLCERIHGGLLPRDYFVPAAAGKAGLRATGSLCGTSVCMNATSASTSAGDRFLP